MMLISDILRSPHLCAFTGSMIIVPMSLYLMATEATSSLYVHFSSFYFDFDSSGCMLFPTIFNFSNAESSRSKFLQYNRYPIGELSVGIQDPSHRRVTHIVTFQIQRYLNSSSETATDSHIHFTSLRNRLIQLCPLSTPGCTVPK